TSRKGWAQSRNAFRHTSSKWLPGTLKYPKKQGFLGGSPLSISAVENFCLVVLLLRVTTVTEFLPGSSRQARARLVLHLIYRKNAYNDHYRRLVTGNVSNLPRP